MKTKIIFFISGVSGFLLPFIFGLSLYLAIPQAPWFSWTDNAISDLGRPEFQLVFFNYLLTCVGGILFLFTIGLYVSTKSRIASTLFALSSIYFIGVGIFPLPSTVHIDISNLFFIAFPLGFFFIGKKLANQEDHMLSLMGKGALVITLSSILSPLSLIFFQGIAIPEMIILIPGFIWCLLYGVYLLFRLKES